MDKAEAQQLSVLSLAFLGDAVFTLFVRDRLVAASNGKSGELHLIASKYVCAAAQAKMIEAVSDALTADERDVARRARNCHNPSRAKNATLADYKKATSLEAVLGYLWAAGDRARANELMALCVDVIDKGENK